MTGLENGETRGDRPLSVVTKALQRYAGKTNVWHKEKGFGVCR